MTSVEARAASLEDYLTVRQRLSGLSLDGFSGELVGAWVDTDDALKRQERPGLDPLALERRVGRVLGGGDLPWHAGPPVRPASMCGSRIARGTDRRAQYMAWFCRHPGGTMRVRIQSRRVAQRGHEAHARGAVLAHVGAPGLLRRRVTAESRRPAG